LELPGFEDDFQAGRAAVFLDCGDLVRDALVVAGEKLAAVDHHIDLVRAISNRATDFS
jgi:hypothetical protein